MGDHLQDKFCYWFKIISDFFQIKNSWLGFKNYIRVVHWYAKRKRLTKSTNVRVCSSKERTDVFPPSFSSPGQYQVDNCPPYLSLFRFDTYDFYTCFQSQHCNMSAPRTFREWTVVSDTRAVYFDCKIIVVPISIYYLLMNYKNDESYSYSWI